MNGAEARALRQKLGWPLIVASNRSKVNKAYLSEFENGLRELPPEMLARLESALRAEPMTTGCPCLLIDPCAANCTCANQFSSAGCQRCAWYGSYDQRVEAAQRIAAAIDAWETR